MKSTLAFFVLLGFISACTSEDKEVKDNSLLGSGFGFNNVTLLVKDLDSARNYYAEVLGFEMPKPDEFEKGIYDGTRVASVFFADASSIELLSVNDTLTVPKPTFITSFLEQHEGVRLYSLHTSSADTTHEWLSSQGFKMDSIKSIRTATEAPKGWSWDDGEPNLRSLEFNGESPAYLPVFMETDWPYKYIQDEWATFNAEMHKWNSHPNGVVGIAALRIVVEDLKTVRKEFKKMGLVELKEKGSENSARFKTVHNQELHLVTPESADDELSDFLKTRGQGVFAIRFEVKNLKKTHEFLKKKLATEALIIDTLSKRLTVLSEYTRGVQLEFIEEPREQAELAQIYSFKEGEKLDSASLKYASGLYTKYCALCHGNNREGHAADNAPSLRSHSLMATTQSPKANYNFLRYTVAYGRAGTAMAGYAKNQGGPLNDADIELLLQWLYELSGVKKNVELSTESITGNAALGETLYKNKCATCHGLNGEGVSAPALGNPMFLATASDEFLRYAISEGREDTPMQSFKDSLTKVEVNNLVAYIRSRASGWNAPGAVTITEPLPEHYVLNPYNKTPKFILREERYVSSEQVLKALQDSSRMIILDARSKAAWHQTHIPGAIPIPYYNEPDTFIKDIPNDSTYIVAYCACPHAASWRVVNTLRRFGYKNTAILDEGILVWTQRGYPVQYGQDDKKKK